MHYRAVVNRWKLYNVVSACASIVGNKLCVLSELWGAPSGSYSADYKKNKFLPNQKIYRRNMIVFAYHS